MRNIILLILVICSFLSCNNYLDVKSDAAYVVPKTLKDIQGLLDDASRMNMGASYTNSPNNLSDDYYISNSILQQTISEPEYSIYNWTMKEYSTSNEWGPIYSIIYNANLALELLEKVERNSQNAFEWDRAKGSALFVRSFHFLALVTLHGHAYDEKTADTYLGIPLRMTSDFNVKSTRATIRECYDRILVDLEVASQLLPITKQAKTRPTKPAALAMLARTNLYMGNYKEARDFSKEALQYNSTLMNFNGDEDIISFDAQYPFKQFNKETIYYVSTSMSWGVFSTSKATVDSILMKAFAQEDLRRPLFFQISNNVASFKGTYTGTSVLFCGISTAELYLMLSEAESYLGNVEDSLAILNTLLKTRWDSKKKFVPLLANSREEALQIIRLERRKELVFRNLRWIDVKRYNREGEGIVLRRNINGQIFTLNPNDAYYAFPLPQDIIEMTGMKQN